MEAKFPRPEEGEPGTPGTFFPGCTKTGTRLPGGSAGAASPGGSSALPAAGRSRIRSAQPRKRFLPSCPPPLPPRPPFPAHQSSRSLPPSIPPSLLPAPALETPPRQLRRRPARTPRSPAGSHAWAPAGWGPGRGRVCDPRLWVLPRSTWQGHCLLCPHSADPDGSALLCPHGAALLGLHGDACSVPMALPCSDPLALPQMALPPLSHRWL